MEIETWFSRWIKESSWRRKAFWIDDKGRIIDCTGVTHGKAIQEKLKKDYGIPIDVDYMELEGRRGDYPEISDKHWDVISERSDGAEYTIGLREWNWVRVDGNNVMIKSLDPSTMRRAADGLEEVYGFIKAYHMEYMLDIMEPYIFARVKLDDLRSGKLPPQTSSMRI